MTRRKEPAATRISRILERIYADWIPKKAQTVRFSESNPRKSALKSAKSAFLIAAAQISFHMIPTAPF
ncbi:MAG TPA: hypothetical protein PLO67_21575, partial [Saprospiraceae bacterium]|nr:hypothetical protein [Saprospiraceae bacterium]